MNKFLSIFDVSARYIEYNKRLNAAERQLQIAFESGVGIEEAERALLDASRRCTNLRRQMCVA